MGTTPKVTVLYFIFLAIPLTYQDSKGKDNKAVKGSSEESQHAEEHVREGLRCYKCDPTENNNYCRDFKPKLATPYDCTISVEPTKTAKTPSPLNLMVNPEMPFSCYKIKGDAAYGHGKVYGAKRYGCGHVTKVRNIEVATGEIGCSDARMPAKGKDFFDGTVCNCDNADGCNSAEKVSGFSSVTKLLLTFSLSISLLFC